MSEAKLMVETGAVDAQSGAGTACRGKLFTDFGAHQLRLFAHQLSQIPGQPIDQVRQRSGFSAFHGPTALLRPEAGL